MLPSNECFSVEPQDRVGFRSVGAQVTVGYSFAPNGVENLFTNVNHSGAMALEATKIFDDVVTPYRFAFQVSY